MSWWSRQIHASLQNARTYRSCPTYYSCWSYCQLCQNGHSTRLLVKLACVIHLGDPLPLLFTSAPFILHNKQIILINASMVEMLQDKVDWNLKCTLVYLIGGVAAGWACWLGFCLFPGQLGSQTHPSQQLLGCWSMLLHKPWSHQMLSMSCGRSNWIALLAICLIDRLWY